MTFIIRKHTNFRKRLDMSKAWYLNGLNQRYTSAFETINSRFMDFLLSVSCICPRSSSPNFC